MDPIALAIHIKGNAPRETFEGKEYYIVERDLKLLESEVPEYAKTIAAHDSHQPAGVRPEGLVAATIDGKPMRWKLPVSLGWAIDESSFDGRAAELAKARDYCQAATKDWNDAAKEQGIDHLVKFEEDTKSPVFRFAFVAFTTPGLYAVAFFPNDAVSKRWVQIGPATFATPNDFDPVGVIRHELGHVLGFRHEHIRPEARPGTYPGEIRESWVVGDIGGDKLTDYDSQSVMHYPLSNGRGTMDFKLSDKDKEGFGKLYLMAASEVKEFAV